MPRRKKKPSYSLHKPTGQAYARLNGKVVYLGKYGTPESKDRYDEVVAAWLEVRQPMKNGQGRIWF